MTFFGKYLAINLITTADRWFGVVASRSPVWDDAWGNGPKTIGIAVGVGRRALDVSVRIGPSKMKDFAG